SALKFLVAAQAESLKQKVNVAIFILGQDGRILASSKSEKMGPQLYDYATYKAQTSCFKGCCTEELAPRNGKKVEIVNMGRLKVIRGVKGGVPLYYKGKLVGAIGVSGAHQDIDKVIALKGVDAVKGLELSK
ncbi:MAG: heme-binding protein, partial [Lentisphaeraceae bacterium]|nr:heme-binding protein [Lentisphaeraceae bacterium]